MMKEPIVSADTFNLVKMLSLNGCKVLPGTKPLRVEFAVDFGVTARRGHGLIGNPQGFEYVEVAVA